VERTSEVLCDYGNAAASLLYVLTITFLYLIQIGFANDSNMNDSSWLSGFLVVLGLLTFVKFTFKTIFVLVQTFVLPGKSASIHLTSSVVFLS
jgi:hypothetical protein